MSNVKVTFKIDTLQLIGDACNNALCIECPFNVSEDDYVLCALKDVNGRSPYLGWDIEDDRMEDDLK